MKVTINNKEIRKYLDIEPSEFPKYASPLISLANQYAQGTRPKVVGQMSDLIQQFTGKLYPNGKSGIWRKNHDAIREATEKILQMMKNLKNTMDKIDGTIVEQWVKDLVIVKTFIGLRFHEAILKKGAEMKQPTWRLSEHGEESKGIDGYIGDVPVSIKPHTYEAKASLPERIDIKIIYYKKTKGGIVADYREIL
jgi:hypothetical protein